MSMENSSQASSGTSGPIFLSALSNVDLAKGPTSLNVETAQRNLREEQTNESHAVALVQINDGMLAEGQQFYQIVSEPYEAEQQSYTSTQSLHDKQVTASNDVGLGQLASSLPLSVSDGAVTVIESGGQHYLIVPNFPCIGAESGEQLVFNGANIVAGNISCSSLSQTSQETVASISTQNASTLHQAITVTQASTVSQALTINPAVSVEAAISRATAETSKTSSITTIPAKISGLQKMPASVLKFHNLSADGRHKKTSEVVSGELNMLDIIPSFFQRTVHQQTEVANSCKYCKFKATTLEQMENHMVEHKKDEGLRKKIEQSRPKKPSKKRKAQMIRTATPKVGTFPSKCKVCQELLKNPTQYRKHLRLHKNEKPHKCEECSETFNKEHNLKLHKSLHKQLDPTRADKYQCPECSREFSRLAGLKMHISMHAEEENFICKECGDEFTMDETLTQHILEHNVDVARHLHRQQKVQANLTGGHTDNVNNAPSPSLYQEISTPTPTLTKRRGRGSVSNKIVGAHSCNQCGKSFQKKSQLNRHLLIHTGEKPHKCETCGKAFNQKSALQLHSSLHSGEKKFSCPHCPQSYRQRGNLNLHIRRVHVVTETEEKKYTCQYCPCVFKKLGSLNSHVTKYHKQLSLTGSQLVSTENGTLNETATMHDEELENILNVVYDNNASSNMDTTPPLSNRRLSTDIVHQAINECVNSSETEKNAPHVLTELQTSSSSLSSDGLLAGFETTIPVEIQTQHVDQSDALMSLLSTTPAQSQVDDTTNQSSTALLQQPIVANQASQIVNYNDGSVLEKAKNWKTKLIDGLRYHECLFCQKAFRKPSDLQRHIRVHTLEKPFKCKQCGKAFTVKSSLTAHIRSHLGIKPYRCLTCHRSFTTAGSLRIHSRLHTGAKPFPCPHCDKRFRTSGQRSNHVCLHYKSNTLHSRIKRIRKKPTADYSHVKMLPPMISTSSGNLNLVGKSPSSDAARGEKPHRCSLCLKSFRRIRSLHLHTKLHSGEKPHKCSHCDKRFVAEMYLKAHIKMHTGTSKFACNVCHSKFSTKGSLKRHAAKHSNDRPYLCPYCNKSFKTYDSCSKHIKGHRKQVASMVVNVSSPQQTHPIMNIPFSAIANQTTQSLHQGGAISELPAQQGLGGTFIQNLQHADGNSDQSPMEQVNPNMVQNISILGQTLPAEGQQEVTTNIPTSGSNQDIGRDASQAGLQYLTSLPVSDPQLLLDPISSQDPLQYFEFNLAEDSTNAVEQELYARPINLVTTPTDLMPADIPVILENPPPKTPRPKRRGKYFGGKELPYGEQIMYQCTGCETIFSSSDFVEHAKKISSKRHDLTYLCNLCCHRFPNAAHYRSHLEFHKVESGVVYKCEKCGTGFTDKSVCEEHRLNHCNQDVVEVSSVPQKKLNAPSAKQKTSSALKTRTSFVRFTEDQNKILSQTNPNLHMTVSERILLSAVAEKDRIVETVAQKRGRFKAPETNGPRHKYACQHCPKSFSKNCDLVRHIRTHTGEKPFKCKTCGKSFSVKSCLVSHEKIHLGVKEFRCHICDLMYSSRASLKVHMRLHTGSLPFKCPHCEQRFRTSGHRLFHIATHTQPRKKYTKSKKDDTHTHSSYQQAADQSNVIVSDLTLTLPEGILQANEPLQLQWNGQNFQIMSGASTASENLTLQIDPASLHQAINAPAVSASQDIIRSYTRPAATSPAPNLVIQPITLPESVLRDQGGVSEVNVAVPANLAPFAQIFVQSGNAGASQHTASGQSLDDKTLKENMGEKDVAIVLTPELASQELVSTGAMQQFALDLLNSDDC